MQFMRLDLKKDAGTLNGILSNNVLKGTYHNSMNNSSGLIEFTFTEEGFNCKWKQGLEPGPMRGKWQGILFESLQNNGLDVFVEFGVVNENGGDVELKFNTTFSNLNISLSDDNITEKEYSTIISNENILLFCKNEILNTDEYFLENGSFYNLRILKVNQFDLDFIWNVTEEDSMQKLKTFFQVDSDNFDDYISDFESDNICSLSYVNEL